MAKHVARSVSALAGAGILLGSAFVALANIPRDGGDLDVNGNFDAGNQYEVASSAFMPPVSGGALFETASVQAPACMSQDDVLARLDADRQALGGETVMLETGLDQAFADEWRRQTGRDAVPVSAVLAHVIGQDADGIVDVVEFDAGGCAMSRTVLDVNDWAYLLHSTVDGQV